MTVVYLVEDNAADVELVREAFRGVGHEGVLHVADDAESAARLFAEAGRGRPAPALVILDLTVPRLDAFDLLARLRADLAVAHVPIVVLSGSMDPRDRDAALGRGAADFMQKPTDADGCMAVGRRLVALVR